MSVVTNPELVERAESLIARCREARLDRFVNELSLALQTDMSLTRLAITHGGANEIAAASESRHRLAWLVSIVSDTLREACNAPITHHDGEVHAFAAAFTPGQIPGLVKRLVAAAYHAQQQSDRAARLTRRALDAHEIVSIQ